MGPLGCTRPSAVWKSPLSLHLHLGLGHGCALLLAPWAGWGGCVHSAQQPTLSSPAAVPPVLLLGARSKGRPEGRPRTCCSGLIATTTVTPPPHPGVLAAVAAMLLADRRKRSSSEAWAEKNYSDSKGFVHSSPYADAGERWGGRCGPVMKEQQERRWKSELHCWISPEPRSYSHRRACCTYISPCCPHPTSPPAGLVNGPAKV